MPSNKKEMWRFVRILSLAVPMDLSSLVYLMEHDHYRNNRKYRGCCSAYLSFLSFSVFFVVVCLFLLCSFGFLQ